MKQKIVVLTGAGMSAESGISTFRDSNGLWENHDIMEVASPEGWRNNPSLVLDFYNKQWNFNFMTDFIHRCPKENIF